MTADRPAADGAPVGNPDASPWQAPLAKEPGDGPVLAALALDELPSLNRDPAFWGMVVTQFLGAFNDNLFKQLMLLLAVGYVAAGDLQGLATALFALPFVLLSGLAGFLADRYSKRPIIVLAKVAEIGVMLLGLAAFLAFPWTGFNGLLFALFLMGTQSTFFGPGKYGILPEMLRQSDLPRANGIILMTTFLAIIFGTAAAGALLTSIVPEGEEATLARAASRLWIGSAVCVVIAMVGAACSLLIRRTPVAQPGLAFSWSAMGVPHASRQMLGRDRPLLLALLASCMFWLVAGVCQMSVNALGERQLGLTAQATSALAAMIGLGIAVGAVVGGRLCRGRADARVVKTGAWGIVAMLLTLSLPGPFQGHLLGFWGSLPVLALLGVSAGFFAIPVQVLLQSRPPKELKGRMVALMNQANFVAILLAGGLYTLFNLATVRLGLPLATSFAMTAALMLPVAICYRPPREAP